MAWASSRAGAAGMLALLLAGAIAAEPVAGIAGEAAVGPSAAVRGSLPAALCESYRGLPDGFGPGRAGQPNRAGLVHIAGGTFLMGSDQGYREEREVHRVSVAAFSIDRHEVTNAQFAAFVRATGHVTVAERRSAAGPAGSAVFVPPKSGAPADAAYRWWVWVPGADWRHPSGPGSSIAGKDNHPVVHIAYEDARAYADWLGRSLPTEAQWEYAARGGLDGAAYAWGNVPRPNGREMANTWQGRFPQFNSKADGHAGTAPVGCFPANGYGLYDTIGNIWEWTADVYRPGHAPDQAVNPLIATREPDAVTGDGNAADMARVIKGGSFLCAPDFCVRYRPASRQPQEATVSTIHVGFRTVLNR
ncbi:Hercynine oxygenase [compost metagenome]